MANIEVGERIRNLRQMQNFTREDLAERIEVSSKFLYEIETGRKGFSADTLCRISKVLLVSCDYIMFGEEKEHQSVQQLAGVLKDVQPLQLRKIVDVIKTFCDICEVPIPKD